jgi:hypothetical protein
MDSQTGERMRLFFMKNYKTLKPLGMEARVTEGTIQGGTDSALVLKAAGKVSGIGT